MEFCAVLDKLYASCKEEEGRTCPDEKNGKIVSPILCPPPETPRAPPEVDVPKPIEPRPETPEVLAKAIARELEPLFRRRPWTNFHDVVLYGLLFFMSVSVVWQLHVAARSLTQVKVENWHSPPKGQRTKEKCDPRANLTIVSVLYGGSVCSGSSYLHLTLLKFSSRHVNRMIVAG